MSEQKKQYGKVPLKYKNDSLVTAELRNDEQGILKDKLYRLFNPEREQRIQECLMTFNPDNITPFFESYLETEEEKLACDEYKMLKKEKFVAENSRPWSLTILGTVGNGKTTLTCGWVNDFNRLVGGALYVTQGDLVEDYKDEFELNIYRKYSEAPVLVLDEINVKDMTDYNRNLIQKILNDRYANQRLTVIIANLSGKQFKNVFDEHILSRLREGLTQMMLAPDMREKKEF